MRMSKRNLLIVVLLIVGFYTGASLAAASVLGIWLMPAHVKFVWVTGTVLFGGLVGPALYIAFREGERGDNDH